MAKLTLLLASFAVLLLVANASIYRTTIEINDSCEEQIRRQEELSHCQQHMKQEAQRQRGRRDRPEQHLRDCCNQLQGLDSRCVCEGLKRAVQQQERQQEEYGHRVEAQEMYDVARNLPSRCGLQETRCDFGQSWWY